MKNVIDIRKCENGHWLSCTRNKVLEEKCKRIKDKDWAVPTDWYPPSPEIPVSNDFEDPSTAQGYDEEVYKILNQSLVSRGANGKLFMDCSSVPVIQNAIDKMPEKKLRSSGPLVEEKDVTHIELVTGEMRNHRNYCIGGGGGIGELLAHFSCSESLHHHPSGNVAEAKFDKNSPTSLKSQSEGCYIAIANEECEASEGPVIVSVRSLSGLGSSLASTDGQISSHRFTQNENFNSEPPRTAAVKPVERSHFESDAPNQQTPSGKIPVPRSATEDSGLYGEAWQLLSRKEEYESTQGGGNRVKHRKNLTFKSLEIEGKLNEEMRSGSKLPFAEAIDTAGNLTCSKRNPQKYDVLQPVGKYWCSICGSILRNGLNLELHKRIHEEGDKLSPKSQPAKPTESSANLCWICGEQTDTEQSLIAHMDKEHMDQVQCNEQPGESNKVAASSCMISSPMNSPKLGRSSPLWRFPCPSSSRKMYNISHNDAELSHFPSILQNLKESGGDQPIPSFETPTIPQALDELSPNSNLKPYHSKNKDCPSTPQLDDVSTFSCSHCNQAFVSKSALNFHQQLFAVAQSSIPSKSSNNASKQESRRRRRGTWLNKSTSNPPKKTSTLCSDCGSTWPSVQAYSAHKRFCRARKIGRAPSQEQRKGKGTASPTPSPSNFPRMPQQGETRFSRKKSTGQDVNKKGSKSCAVDYLPHLTMHLKMGKLDFYSCNFCGMTSRHQIQVARHSRAHVGQNPYFCPHCKESFKEKPLVISHVAQKHCFKDGSSKFVPSRVQGSGYSDGLSTKDRRSQPSNSAVVDKVQRWLEGIPTSHRASIKPYQRLTFE